METTINHITGFVIVDSAWKTVAQHSVRVKN